ncbi:O-antigen ligase family protein [Hymenobacter aerilatus]|uniref:O-antigen ligase family protein n=1 Tax=Hymenobacter aerilatus TaxID=2932251 RepID=A0A8T9SPN3_9BACT|nr:O-antigen ligase family protein [Hymenobacter aerilatus]UOR03667.1 O-antigen ligase family protein [Hymenobacter aerilatus]
MKIKLNFLALIPFLAILATSKAFWEFAFGADRVDQEPGELKFLVYALLAGSLASIWFYWRYFEPLMRKWLIAVLLVIGGMMLESYAEWGSVLEYAHVFNKLFVLLTIFGIYGFYRRHGLPPMQQLSTVILLVSVGNLLLFHRESLSLSAFVENTRGFNAASAYLFVLVILLSLNNYLLRNSLTSLLIVFVCMPLVIFLQHRSVWIAMFIAIPIDVLLLRRARLARFSPVKMVMLLVIPFILGSLGVTMLVLDNPQVVTRFEQSIDDIANADKQGTGSWRLKQIESYLPLVEERPVAGWRLEGFEVPMQFYDPSSDMPMWKDRTGHHFHNFYLDRAFYFGILGILLVVLVPIVLVTRRLLRSRFLDADTAALVAFFISLIVFGTSYDWSTYHYGLIGLMLAALAEPMTDPFLLQPRSAAHARRVSAPALPI